MITRAAKPSAIGGALLVAVTAAPLSTRTGASAQNEAGSPFEQVRVQLTRLQARVDTLQPRTFYLTVDTFGGAHAPAACASGFHMASLWEVFDPTGLRYDTTRGFGNDDSGSGPPSGVSGWIRTGRMALAAGGPGVPNCNAYTSGEVADLGSVARLEHAWEAPAGQGPPWEPLTQLCSVPMRVWCVQD
jgi:hypothetical protein